MSLNSSVKRLAKTMDASGINEIDAQTNILFGIIRRRIKIIRGGASAPVAATKTENREPKAEKAVAPKSAITSPMVGVAYLAPEPGAKPFVAVGDTVKAGDNLCLIEAMKTFNQVKSDRAGVVREILVSDGQVVEFGQPLIVIE
ncbi:MAG: hypothetical protein LBR41_01330 [Rickettsiales bacterium]|jgi:acetyl-CoA carboxylase biotin carboxyl carrier protein|nr:hypothetical protein [Rickettsiales bacterium]